MLRRGFYDDIKIKKLLTKRLIEKYKTETQPYDPDEDNEADAEMNSVNKLLQTCNTDLYNIVFTINEKEPPES